MSSGYEAPTPRYPVPRLPGRAPTPSAPGLCLVADPATRPRSSRSKSQAPGPLATTHCSGYDPCSAFPSPSSDSLATRPTPSYDLLPRPLPAAGGESRERQVPEPTPAATQALPLLWLQPRLTSACMATSAQSCCVRLQATRSRRGAVLITPHKRAACRVLLHILFVTLESGSH